uniref:recombinase family protein n=1 Tax=Zhongshania sp. TaxID=1971902 RepID=UPI00356B1036
MVEKNHRLLIPAGGGCIGVIKIGKYFLTPLLFVDTTLSQLEVIMSRVFAYCRVSTTEQATENQLFAIQKAGFEVTNDRCVSETISGSTEAMKRPAFRAMVEHSLEKGDTLVVLKLDRLGRDA